MSHPSLLVHFPALDDPRQRGEGVYPLAEVMLLVLCATLAGAEDLSRLRPGGAESSTSCAGLCPLRAASSRMIR